MDDFQRIAGGIGQRFVHVSQKCGCLDACAVGHFDKRLCQSFRIFQLLHKRAIAKLHIQHKALQTGCQLLGKNGGGNQRNGFTVAVTSRTA